MASAGTLQGPGPTSTRYPWQLQDPGQMGPVPAMFTGVTQANAPAAGPDGLMQGAAMGATHGPTQWQQPAAAAPPASMDALGVPAGPSGPSTPAAGPDSAPGISLSTIPGQPVRGPMPGHTQILPSPGNGWVAPGPVVAVGSRAVQGQDPAAAASSFAPMEGQGAQAGPPGPAAPAAGHNIAPGWPIALTMPGRPISGPIPSLTQMSRSSGDGAFGVTPPASVPAALPSAFSPTTATPIGACPHTACLRRASRLQPWCLSSVSIRISILRVPGKSINVLLIYEI